LRRTLAGRRGRSRDHCPAQPAPCRIGRFRAIVAAACLAHDIGNPPFGHAGEDAIREWFRSPACWNGTISPAQKADFERYEGNAQGFRIVSRLQSPANPGGLQLTSAVLATFTKYPRPSHLDSELDGKSGKKFGFFQQDADNLPRWRGQPAWSSGAGAGLAAPSAGIPGRSGG
jgi:predicted deoxyguanosinetriphosphate triphosphohydrolase